MIRRDIRFSDGFAGWALISQIEHARISVQLAELCMGRFTEPGLKAVRTEVLAAIRSHDDGWAEWEQTPRLHADSRPVSFMELQPAEALAVWSRSIERSAAHGPLASWMVAGHFCRLLDIHSPLEKREPPAQTWYDAMQRRRGQWLTDWRAMSPAVHAFAVADEALQWLWTFDEVSLWFCCTCPCTGEMSDAHAGRGVAGKGTPIQMHLAPLPSDRTDAARGLATSTPWRFSARSIDISAAASIVPRGTYANGAALLAASKPCPLRWTFATSA